MAPEPHTVKEIFKDYKARRTALINALTRDADQVYNLCDPETENLCLYGNSDETWEVGLPEDQVPPDLPQPVLGINFGREGISRRDWLLMAAIHSDSWLVSVAFFLAHSFDRVKRNQLFNLMNNLPNIAEVVAKWKPDEDKSTMDRGNSSRENTQSSNVVEGERHPKVCKRG